MTSLLILFFGTFWEASMDILGQKHNYKSSKWQTLANYFDKKGLKKLGNTFWDNSIAWRNKWKNGDPKCGERFPGSSTVFSTVMDGWHFTKFVWLVHVFMAIALFESFTDHLLLDLVILYVTFGIGHECFLHLLKKRPT